MASGEAAASPAGARGPGRVARGYARAVVGGRHVVLAVWILLLVGAVQLPAISTTGGSGGLDGFIDAENPTVATEIASAREFGFPLLSRTVLVQRDPDGLSPYAQAEAVLRAAALTRGQYEDAGPIVAALPVVNTLGVFPGSRERDTTALTYLLARPGASFASQSAAGQRFADTYLEPDDAAVGVTGSVPARVEQGRIVADALPVVEAVTLSAILLIVGLTFRSVIAPVLALGTAALAFVVSTRLAAFGGELLGIAIPSELEPLILALLLGVTTDYAIFFLSGLQHQVRAGLGRHAAARAATAEFAPIVGVAGLTVTAGTAALLVADSAFFRAFGPAMALSVAMALIVSMTLVPALMALLGRWAFWPSTPPEHPAEAEVARRPVRAVRRFRGRGVAVRLITYRPVALLVVLACAGVLLVAAVPARGLQLGVGFVASLPSSSPVSAAAQAAATGFAPGILSPSVLLLRQPDLDERRGALADLADGLREVPGVAGVLAPGDLLPRVERGALLAPSGDAARMLVVLDDDALGASAIDTLRSVERAMPDLLDEAELGGVEWGVGGDTALAAGLVDDTRDDLGRIITAALLVNLLMLVLFLRALVAPLYLLACSVLALVASLGVTTYVFQDLLGHDGITFYVPFAAAVLLIALGSDYNIFGVGHIWSTARGRPLRDAIRIAVPQTTRAITIAGVTLATSFGLLALVPLRPFRELALVMAVGIMIDAVLVRSLLVPSLLVLVGRASGWPGRVLSPRRARTPGTTDSDDPGSDDPDSDDPDSDDPDPRRSEDVLQHP